jgi:hypothetical protein
MLSLVLVLGGLALFMANTGVAQDDKKEVTLKGTITCGKCDLMVDKQCATVIVVKDAKGKDVVFYFDMPSHKEFHDGVCTEAKKGSVVGTVKDEGKKKIVSVKKVNYDK